MAYYNEAEDQQNIQNYYTGINHSAPSFSELNNLLTHTHTKELEYAPSRHLYPLVDLHPDGLIRSIYSGKTFTAEELIKMDEAIELARQQERAILNEKASLMSEETYQLALEAIEAALPFNCEHVVPQSWFVKQNPMRGDLHHLFACETVCNSFRGNLAYYDFKDYEPAPVITIEAVRNLCGKSENNTFEPENNKGVAARAVLYFMIRYPGRLSDKYNRIEEINMLLDWHQSQPVTLFEKHRNECIYKVQGNRNPVVDMPEWIKNNFFE